MDEFWNRIIPPVDPGRVKHVEQHGEIGIRRHRELDDPSGTHIELGDRKVVREFVASRRWDQAEDDLSSENDENG